MPDNGAAVSFERRGRGCFNDSAVSFERRGRGVFKGFRREPHTPPKSSLTTWPLGLIPNPSPKGEGSSYLGDEDTGTEAFIPSPASPPAPLRRARGVVTLETKIRGLMYILPSPVGEGPGVRLLINLFTNP